MKINVKPNIKGEDGCFSQLFWLKVMTTIFESPCESEFLS